jgi:hypothetical protein
MDVAGVATPALVRMSMAEKSVWVSSSEWGPRSWDLGARGFEFKAEREVRTTPEGEGEGGVGCWDREAWRAMDVDRGRVRVRVRWFRRAARQMCCLEEGPL